MRWRCCLCLAAASRLALAAPAEEARGDASALLQERGWFSKGKRKAEEVVVRPGEKDLVFMHVPFNFGHTVETVGMMPEFARDLLAKKRSSTEGSRKSGVAFSAPRGLSAKLLTKKDGVHWGHFNADIDVESKETKCSLYFTPPKYWPSSTAQAYFANRTVFGMLRDPYERLVSMFRGNVAGYGAMDQGLWEKCDINGGIKKMLKDYLAKGDKFASECTFLPQAEYYEGEFGITLPIDNRRFPHSMNEAFEKHGYTNMHIRPSDVIHVHGCEDSWAADLDAETRGLVKQIYRKDFELLCQEFGYCDQEESTCLTYIPQMCPPKAFRWDEKLQQYRARRKS